MRWWHFAIALILFVMIDATISIADDVSVTVIPTEATDPIIISNISPDNNSYHVDITNNPPDGSGYVTLSWQINDTNGGGDLEFYMDIWNGTAWVNRLHLTDQSNGTWSHDETAFNHTNTTYHWRLCCKDGTTGQWVNRTYLFTTDKKPNPPSNPQPANTSMVEAGNITLAVKVTHSDAGAGVKIYNVSFYEYPSGRLIGWNYSSSGFANGTIVKCNQTYHLEYEGTKYYWYARCKDDEYWSDNSSVWYVETYYNDTEPPIVYYTIGAEIYVQPEYTESEPNIVYYTLGAEIHVYNALHYHNPSPNATTNEPLSVKLTVQVNKTGTNATYNFTFLTNATVNGSWVEIGKVSNVNVGNNLTNVSLWWSGLDWNTTYYWYVSSYDPVQGYVNSSIYSFKTKLTDPEPDVVYYTIGSQIYVKPNYTESEPSIVYYTLGSQISVHYAPVYHNPSPNGTTGEWLSVNLSIQVNKTGEPTRWDFTFLTNATVNGSWVAINTLHDVLVPNATLKTIHAWFSGLDWNTTYYWYVSAYNATLGVYSNSSIYSFTTRLTDPEHNIVYYTIGSQIYVKPNYTTPEPDVVYYTLGAEVSVSKPYPQDPIPANNTAYGTTSLNFSVYIHDVNASDVIDSVKFYWSNGTEFGEVTNVSANTRANVSVSGLHRGIWYEWYVVVYDGNWSVRSDTWRYRPYNNLPIVTLTPANNSNNVAVYRKLVSGEWKRFVRLQWNLTDPDGDGMNFTLYIKDPSTGNWIMRWQRLENAVTNGTYYHDEMAFNETLQHYYWKLIVSDGYNTTTYNMTFFTQFFIDFWWYPEYPTQDDIVHFYSLTEGADDFRWEFGDGTNITGVNETTHQYLIAGYYNVTLWVYNSTNDVWGSLTKTIRIDRNITLLTPKEGEAGYNYFAWQGNITNASKLAELLNLSRGYWIHYYNSTSDEWEGYFVGYNAGINSHIKNWDATVIVINKNKTVRINATELFNYSLKNQTFVKTGYNVVSWSVYSVKNASSIPLDNGEWVYKWDNINRTWKAYLKGVGGDNFQIKPYDVVVTYMTSSRWWNLMFGG